MAPRKKKTPPVDREENTNAHIMGAGEVVDQEIVETLEINYMPYAMSVIMSRAIPEIDGFKPSHRKLLYTMYKMGLLNGARIKSANIVGRTMQLNPHGDAAIYDTMVRLSRGYEALLHPYVDSKGNFGKAYSRDMSWAASRYTEAKLDKLCNELFRDIDMDTVDFVDNYDASMKEPTLLPVTFPSVLVNNNTGIAVGMASSICSFNLKEICETTVELIKDPEYDIMQSLQAPDFPGGGQVVYDRDQMAKVFASGRGGIVVRSKYNYDKSNNCIDITEIPPTTTSEAIIDKIIEKAKAGQLREVSDIRDETDKSGLKITIDLKRGADPEKLMKKLFKMTPLEDSFPCNFNVLIAGMPQVLGVKGLLEEWIAFRMECVRRRVYFDLTKAKDKLHLLEGLQKILLDIDKAIRIVRETEEESEVVPNLMIGFGIDEIQAEYVAEIKLRHLNREFILKRLKDVEDLKKTIEDLEDTLKNKRRIKKIIIEELQQVAEKYGQPRKTEILYASELDEEEEEDLLVSADPCTLFFTKESYFKKISPQSLRMSGEQNLKENDEILQVVETTNDQELLFFSDRYQVYKSRGDDFGYTKASVLGDYVPTILTFDEGETAIYMAVTKKYKGFMLFLFENGKVAKVDMSCYYTKTRRKKLLKAYSDKSPLAAAMYLPKDCDLVIENSSGRLLLLNTATIAPKTTKNTQGVSIMRMKKGQRAMVLRLYEEGEFKKPSRYKTKTYPALGAFPAPEDTEGEQLSLT
ncbi:MAG: topoisomerase IV [Clostridia bacterium]|nr:topoisomerase IV [Clostridia bacterium]